MFLYIVIYILSIGIGWGDVGDILVYLLDGNFG